MGAVLLRILVGGTAGLAAWALIEPSAPQLPGDPSYAAFELRFILVLGAFIGGSLGWLEGWRRGTMKKMAVGFFAGALFGMMGTVAGAAIGGIPLRLLFPPDVFFSNNLAIQIPARLIVMISFGVCLGLAVGASTFNARRARITAMGGLLAGIVTGLSFDIASLAVSPFVLAARGVQPGESVEIGMTGRGLMAGLLGIGLGLFIGFLEQVLKTAWVRQEFGRKEGREWIVDAPITVIGRSEAAQVPLFGDTSVAPNHASIVRQGDAYWLFDAGTPAGTLVNGQRVAQVPLQSGDRITVGAATLTFALRAGSAPAKAAEALRGAAPVAPVMVPAAPAPIPTPTPAPTPAPAPGRLALVVLGGPLAGSRYPVGSGLEIGREASGVKLAYDSGASRRHARVAPDGIALEVVDLQSTNGVFINGSRISGVAPARVGDVVKIGATEFRVEGP